jgi:high affinity Mn2+ porin
MRSKHWPFLLSAILHLCILCASGQEPPAPTDTVKKGMQHEALLGDSGWSYHFQFTGIEQGHFAFRSPYSGQNSLQRGGEQDYSVTSTIYLGRTLWKGAALYFNPEMAGGSGLSSTRGVAGFPNGETFRIGDPAPAIYIARLFLRQHLFLDKDHFEDIRDDANQVTERVSSTRITITAGKFSLGDFFDDNGVSHDPRTDFMNWALMSNGAYDYAANTRGYTYGLTAEYVRPGWALRLGTALEPTYANGPKLDGHYTKTNSENLEWEKKFAVHGRKGILRLLAYCNVNKAPDYDQAVAAKLSGTDTSLDAIYGRQYGSKKFGFGVNGEQELCRAVNAFVRAGWNDGKTASWAFAEIDNTISGGIRVSGQGWHRKADYIGIACLSNGVSAPHRNFLNQGGDGVMIGDGDLPDYGRDDVGGLVV